MPDLSRRASSLLDTAIVDPVATMADGARLLDELAPGDLAAQAVARRAMSIASKLLGHHGEAMEMARASAELGKESGDIELEVLGLLALAAPLSIVGEIAEALEVTESAAGKTDDVYLQARCLFQRAQILTLAGDFPAARSAYLEALPVFRLEGDDNMVRGTLGNVGYIDTLSGELDAAEAELSEALEIAVARDEKVAISGISHNLGVLSSYRGDLIGALQRLELSEGLYMEITGAAAPQHVARAQVLLSAGLFREALSLARAVAAANREGGDAEHEGNALLVAAHAAILAGEHASALDLAVSARSTLLAQGRVGLAVEAATIAVHARLTIDGPSPGLLADATEAATAMAGSGAMVAGAEANLVAARIALEMSEGTTAVTLLEKVAAEETGPVEVRVGRHLARALLCLKAGDRAGAGSAIRSGLGLIDRYQAAMGATDLRVGVERHGVELSAIGMGLALESGRPRRILTWMDRTRGRALRYRPVSPSGETGLDDLLGRLRRVEAEMRDAGADDLSGLGLRRRRLQDEIARWERSRRGSGGERDDMTVAALLESLEGESLIELGVYQGRLFGVHARGGRVRRLELGDYEEVTRELGHLRFGMRRSARRGSPFDRAALDMLDTRLLGDADLGDEPVVIVPAGPLMALPWAGLPRLRGRPVRVSPSAETWFRANSRTVPPGAVVVVGGPDLLVAEREVGEIAGLYPSATVLTPERPVDDVLVALDGSSLAHVACHAAFQVENPMFSSLRLGDGDLNVYDVERLGRPPGTVILSACDSGYTETHAGDELTGLTSALLSMGTRSIVASVGLVPDSGVTSNLMVDFHGGLLSGLDPAPALARAQARAFETDESFVAAASFICVGA